MRQILASVKAEADRSGEGAAKYAETLDGFASTLGQADMSSAFTSELQKVMLETRGTETAQRRFGSNMSSLVHEVESLRRELEQVKQESLTDGLTGLANRKAFDKALGTMVAHGSRLRRE